MQITYTSRSVGELIDLRRNGMLAANPEYQRGAVWTSAQKKRLVDSVLRGYPLPYVYLHHIKKAVAGMQREDLEIIDGQQRLNALYEFSENAFHLFDPKKEAQAARFPHFIVNTPCPWGGKDFAALDPEIRGRFLATQLYVAQVATEDPNEVRDLFIRLQAGMPLNAQEKRDAWPGNFTELVLRLGGKPTVARYQGHDFFKRVMRPKKSADRGDMRLLCAQLAILYLSRREDRGRFVNLAATDIDDFYYKNLDLDLESESVIRFREILDILTRLFGDGKRRGLKSHEAMHLVLLVDSLLDDYTRGWESTIVDAMDRFIEEMVADIRAARDGKPGDYYTQYVFWTRSSTYQGTKIGTRHAFFVRKMLEFMDPLQTKDPKRLFGPLEREVIYYRDRKLCQICNAEVAWDDAEIHHVEGHIAGGKTSLDNGVLVHKACHPRGPAATTG